MTTGRDTIDKKRDKIEVLIWIILSWFLLFAMLGLFAGYMICQLGRLMG